MDLNTASSTSNKSPPRLLSERPRTGANSLPYEIMYGVFLTSLPTMEEMRKGGLGKASIKTPLHISHVCQRWRNISLSCGELWSYLCLEIDGRLCSDRQTRKLEIFNAWLERTNDSALNFYIRIDFDAYEADEEAHRDAEYMLVAFTSRQRQWRDVDLGFTGLEVSPEFPGINLAEMPMITSLFLRFSYTIDSICARINLAHSPRLRQLHIHGDFDLESGEEAIHKHAKECRLVFLRRNAPALPPGLDFLKNAPNLERLHLSMNYSFGRGPSCSNGSHELVLRGLHYLFLGHHSDPAFILNNLTVPGLKALHFDDADFRRSGGGELLLSFIHRTMPPLTCLEIPSYQLNEDVLIPILSLLPSLEYLDISFTFVSTRFFETLASREDIIAGRSRSSSRVETVCPELRNLHLRRLQLLGNKDECAHALILMLQSRCLLLGTFRRIWSDEYNAKYDIASIDPSDEQVWDKLRVCAEYGNLFIKGDDAPPYTFDHF